MTLKPTSSSGGSGSGTVTSVSSTNTAISVANGTTTPALTAATLDVIAAQGPPAAAVAMNAQKITGLANPSAAQDAVTKAYTDQAVGGVAWTVVTKQADQTVTGSTTLVQDTELFAALNTGSVYEVELAIVYGGTSTSADIKSAFGEDATVRGVAAAILFTTTDTASVTAIGFGNGTTIGYGIAAANRIGLFKGFYTSNGGTAALWWAQNTATGSTTVRAGSELRYRQIA